MKKLTGGIILSIVFCLILAIGFWLGLQYTRNTQEGDSLLSHISTGNSGDWDKLSRLTPWDPLAWDTLRDPSLSYESSGGIAEQGLYEPLIKNTDKLGFKPDEKYFLEVLSTIKKNYVHKVDEKTLKEGCEKELGLLFKDAQIDVVPSLKEYNLETDFISQITKQYGSSVNPELLIYASTKGLLQSLNDPFSYLIPPEVSARCIEIKKSKEIGSVGLKLEYCRHRPGYVIVIEPINKSPVQGAGAMPGDIIEEINDQSARGITLEAAFTKLSGPVGSEVTLVVCSERGSKRHRIRINCDKIKSPIVSYKVLDGTTGYIRIERLVNGTLNEFENAIRNLRNRKVTSLILDLRNNSTLLTDYGMVMKIASKFAVVERSEPEKRKRNLDDNEFVNNSQSKMKLVVLINRYTARLYEAVAGTIKDNKTGTLIGEKTMGIGNSQKIFPMANHSAIKLTVSQLYTPRGRSINGKGIKPDISISMEPGHAGTDDDVQLKEAISYLKGKQK